MERFIEPTYCITEYIDENTNRFSWYINIGTETPSGQIIELDDPEYQDWELTPMLVWCIKNFNGLYKICITDYKDFFIEIFEKEDALAFKLRWL